MPIYTVMCQILGGNHLVTSYHSVYIFEKYEIPRAEIQKTWGKCNNLVHFQQIPSGSHSKN